MIAHPLVLAVLASEILAAVLVLGAAFWQVRIVLHWSPSNASPRQLELERRAEVASYQGRWAVALLILAVAAFVVAVASALPPLIPGAMCGTGVFQAGGIYLERALIFSLASLAVLLGWKMVDRLGRESPSGQLTLLSARVFLLSVPLVLLAVHASWLGFLSLDTEKPVSCCASVYDTIDGAALSASGGTSGLPALMLFAVCTGVLLPAGIARATWRFFGRSRAAALITAGISLLWCVAAITALIDTFTPYHYGVLHHACPWCLFLSEHHYVGYPLYGAVAVVALDGPAGAIALGLAKRYPEVAEAALHRSYLSGVRLTAAVAIFAVLGAGPAVAWRVSRGMWL